LFAQRYLEVRVPGHDKYAVCTIESEWDDRSEESDSSDSNEQIEAGSAFRDISPKTVSIIAGGMNI